MDMRETLATLMAPPGPSGSESPVTEVARELLAPYADRLEVDRLGNLLGFRACGRDGARVVMLDAHLDEIGFIVTGYDKGYLRFHTLGGIDSRMLPDREIKLLTDPPRMGVVACLPPHVQEKEDYDKSIPVSDLLIDAGLSEEEAPKHVPVGTRGVYIGEPFALGDKQISGHAFDDRACFVILLRTMELLRDKPLAVDLVLCGSVQEELGARGAIAAAFAVQPAAFIAVDVTHAQTPDAPKHKTFTLGGGPCIGMGPGCHRGMAAGLVETARAKGIPHQIEVMEGDTGTNASAAQVAGQGMVTAVVSLPLKYMHSPIETLHLDDMENTAQLLAQYLLSLNGEV